MRWLLGFFVLLASFSTPSAFAQGRIDCSSLQSKILKRAVHYCVQVPGNYDKAPDTRYPVLYYLHGLGDNEQSFSRSGGWTLIEDLREHGKIGDFLIVAPEGGASFYINSADGEQRYSDFFLREFMPYIEKKYRIQPGREARAITGISMGGFGALRFAFAYPELFSAVSAQSPALIIDSPEELNQLGRSRPEAAEALAPLIGDPINISHWKANDPFTLLKKNKNALKTTAVYFNCGQSDDFGFETGAAALDDGSAKVRRVNSGSQAVRIRSRAACYASPIVNLAGCGAILRPARWDRSSQST